MFNIRPNPKQWKIPTVNGIIKTGYFEQRWCKDTDVISETDNIIFDAWIKVTEFGRSRSSVYFVFEDVNGVNKYYTGPQGMFEIIKNLKGQMFSEAYIDDDHFNGTFTFKKQGDNIYLFPYEE